MPASIDPRRSGLGAAAPHMLLRAGEEVAREGRAIHKFLEDTDGYGVNEVITDGRIVFNIPEGRRVLISQQAASLHTQSDDWHICIGWTTAVDGGGVFRELVIGLDLHTGNVQASPQTLVRDFYPLLMVEYSQGARSITLRVTANDVNAEGNLGWDGWWEFE